MAELTEPVEDEFNASKQHIDLGGEIEEEPLICDSCKIRFFDDEQAEGDDCPECPDGELISIYDV